MSIQAYNIVIAGVGGQGTILASKLLSQAAISCGMQVRGAETIGMAQRGGSVVGHIRIGGNAASPLVGEGAADLLIGFELAEAVRSLKLLRPGGHVICADQAVAPPTAALKKIRYDGKEQKQWLKDAERSGHIEILRILNTGEAAKRLGSHKALNVVLLGAACAMGVMPLSAEHLCSTIREHVKYDYVEMNLRAFALGAELAQAIGA